MIDALRNYWETLKTYVTMIDFGDVLDVLIVAVVIYFLFYVLRNTTAMSILKSVVVLFVVLGIAELLSLQVITFLMKSTLQVGLIAVIILFQPELRRLLEQIGGTSFQGFLTSRVGGSSDSAERAITQTVEAVQALSWAREGALIVFERRVRLQDVINTGTVLEASVTSELLKNIFFPKAPMHDGAVIVRDSRIAGAGCMLPLTTNPHLSKELGMRHRAGIGMSENSDAVVVIVSEESGSISVATEGILKRHLMPETLEKLLRSALIPDSEEGKKTIFQRARLLFMRRDADKG
ncbi:MAG: diadenylate cyclase CdaA [Oscillospiraceae bacterium]|jgi:diadenylate cyclase|nr:diadenylate cyclase CdaA [Oscillospiraceae bacterium]